MPGSIKLALGCLVLAVTGVAQAADEITLCPMGGPTPGFKAIRFDLPEGSDFLGIEPHGIRQQRGLSNSDNWHLTEGIFIVNAATFELEAYRVESAGSSPRRVVVRSDGTTVVDQGTTAPDGPFYHNASRPRAGLPAGAYYAIGFGSDGGKTFPNEWWSVDVRIAGDHACTPIGTGTVFDIDQGRFQGGTHAYVGPVGTADGITHTEAMPAGTDIVVGLMDAAVQGGGEATIDYDMPLGDGTVEDEIVPFVSVGGEHRFDATYQGAFPMILVAGVAVNLP